MSLMNQGMINVTNKKGIPGSWINPSETTAKQLSLNFTLIKMEKILQRLLKNIKHQLQLF